MKINYYMKFILACLLMHTTLHAQISIVSIGLQPFNMTSDALLNAGIMNHENEQQVQLFTQLYGSNQEVILSVKSQPFKLVKGMNAGMSGNRKVASVEYSGSAQANYLKTTHNLPSGRYKVCSTLLLASGADKLDDFCDELEADFNQYLYLVNPFDGDTIDTKQPLLSWTHSEPFSILSQGESYRMVVTEIKKEQTAEEAITINTPDMVKTYLKEHQLQYPFDARELKEGTAYAWQVQKLSDGVVINKTEAWIFHTRMVNPLKDMKYVVVKDKLDGSFYAATNGKVFFKFSEEYKSSGSLKFRLMDAKAKNITVDIIQDKEKSKSGETAPDSELKITGDNRYELDMNSKKLASGLYTLEIKNEKNESFYLKIFLQ